MSFDVLNTVRLRARLDSAYTEGRPGVCFPSQSDRAVFYMVSRGNCYRRSMAWDRLSQWWVVTW
jgi:hypothetical protein